MLINFFKTKYRIHEEAKQDGFLLGVKEERKIADREIKRIKEEYEKKLKDKDYKIAKMMKRVNKIEYMLKNSASFFMRAEALLLKTIDTNLLSFRKFTKGLSKKYQNEQDLLEEAVNCTRSVIKIIPSIEESIDKLGVENI